MKIPMRNPVSANPDRNKDFHRNDWTAMLGARPLRTVTVSKGIFYSPFVFIILPYEERSKADHRGRKPDGTRPTHYHRGEWPPTNGCSARTLIESQLPWGTTSIGLTSATAAVIVWMSQ